MHFYYLSNFYAHISGDAVDGSGKKRSTVFPDLREHSVFTPVFTVDLSHV